MTLEEAITLANKVAASSYHGPGVDDPSDTQGLASEGWHLARWLLDNLAEAARCGAQLPWLDERTGLICDADGNRYTASEARAQARAFLAAADEAELASSTTHPKELEL